MATAVDSIGTDSAGFGTTLTFTSGVISGANRLLTVGVAWFSVAGANIASVELAGVNLTCSAAVTTAPDGFTKAQLWHLLAPSTGAGSVEVIATDSCGGIAAGAVSLTGVDQGTPLGTVATATGSTGAPTVNAVGATDDLILDVISWDDTFSAASVGAGQTERWNCLVTTTVAGAGSTEPGAASVTMSWTGPSGNWSQQAVAIKAAAGGATTWGPLTALDNNRLVGA